MHWAWVLFTCEGRFVVSGCHLFLRGHSLLLFMFHDAPCPCRWLDGPSALCLWPTLPNLQVKKTFWSYSFPCSSTLGCSSHPWALSPASWQGRGSSTLQNFKLPWTQQAGAQMEWGGTKPPVILSIRTPKDQQTV